MTGLLWHPLHASHVDGPCHALPEASELNAFVSLCLALLPWKLPPSPRSSCNGPSLPSLCEPIGTACFVTLTSAELTLHSPSCRIHPSGFTLTCASTCTQPSTWWESAAGSHLRSHRTRPWTTLWGSRWRPASPPLPSSFWATCSPPPSSEPPSPPFPCCNQGVLNTVLVARNPHPRRCRKILKATFRGSSWQFYHQGLAALDWACGELSKLVSKLS